METDFSPASSNGGSALLQFSSLLFRSKSHVICRCLNAVPTISSRLSLWFFFLLRTTIASQALCTSSALIVQLVTLFFCRPFFQILYAFSAAPARIRHSPCRLRHAHGLLDAVLPSSSSSKLFKQPNKANQQSMSFCLHTNSTSELYV